MLWERMSAWIVEFSTDSVQFAAGLLLQSSLLIGLGLVASRAVRAKGAALESAVYRTTLVGVIVCPAVSLLLAATGVEGLAVALPEVAWHAEDTGPLFWGSEDRVAVTDPALVAESQAETSNNLVKSGPA